MLNRESTHLLTGWCPTAFSVITGLGILSIKYSSRRDGIAIYTKMTAGTVVQIVSIICPSKINRPVCLFWTILINV